MPDPKNITEATTLAELREQRTLLGVIELHIYRPSDGEGVVASAHHARGFFEGRGPTEANAIEAAFAKLRRALLPERLQQFT